MQYVIDELQKSLRYHIRQLNDNKLEIQSKKESISSLEESNEKHEAVIKEIEDHLNQIRNS